MAAAIALQLFDIATKAVVGSAASKVFGKGLDSISGGSDTEQILDSISKTLKEVEQVKDKVNAMSNKLDVGILALRKDSLNTYLVDIETYYWGIQDCFDQATADVKNTAMDAETLQESLGKLQDRIEENLELVAEKFPGYLDHINSFLQDKTFLNAAASLAFSGSNDFLAYYMRMKVLFTPYWITVVKGITLLEMARLSPEVGFAEAHTTIQRLCDDVAKQESAFVSAVGHDTCVLAEFILADPNSPRPVNWCSGWGSGIEIINVKATPTFLFEIPRARDDAGPQKYLLQVATNVSADDFDFSKSYPARVLSPDGKQFVERLGKSLSICMSWGASKSDCWHIKPTSIGSNSQRFVGVDGPYMNEVLVTGWTENRLEHKQEISIDSGLDGHADRAYYHLHPWT